ncbi:MAG: hypothetical protein RLZ25_1422 [Pseudomonadota bacterium]|jgi:pilus assembly protein Flp/PilA
MKRVDIPFKTQLVRLFREEQGLSMVEYAVAGAVIAAAASTAFTTLGANVVTDITNLATTVAG